MNKPTSQQLAALDASVKAAWSTPRQFTFSNKSLFGATASATGCLKCGASKRHGGPCPACGDLAFANRRPKSLGRKIVTRTVAISRQLFGKFSPEQRKAFVKSGGTITN